MPLSDKAKGKQRAQEQSSAESSLPISKELVFRFTEGIPDLQLNINATDSVKGVKQKVGAKLCRSLINLMHRACHSFDYYGRRWQTDGFASSIQDDCSQMVSCYTSGYHRWRNGRSGHWTRLCPLQSQANTYTSTVLWARRWIPRKRKLKKAWIRYVESLSKQSNSSLL